MTEDLTISQPDPSPNAEDVVERFRKSWRAGEHPRIEDWLAREPSEGAALFSRLLEVELFERFSAGEMPDPANYSQRFPDYAESIRSAFQIDKTIVSFHATDRSDSGVDDETILPDQPANAPTPNSKPNEPIRHQQVGDFEVISEIARGGMGVVYKARQISLNRTVALKMTLAGQFASNQERARFHTEAEAAAQLDHPSIVPVYAVGEHEGLPYYAMGFVEGESLSDQVRRGPISVRRAVELCKQLAEGVHHAHQHGIVHRDLKPANVLIDQVTGHPRITDFGLAKSESDDSGLTVSGQVLGTPSYMPPEQASGQIEQIGPRSDVYSLGGILYAMVTGRPPFQSTTITDTLKQVLEAEPVSPRLLNPALSIDVETICLKCLQKAPAKRYQTGLELAEDLSRFQRGEPILARPVGQLERTWRWCRRNPSLALMIIGIALLLTAVTSISTFAYLLEKDLRSQTENLATANLSLARSEGDARRDAVRKAEELRDALIEQSFQSGLASFDSGRNSEGIASIWRAWKMTPLNDSRRTVIQQVLVDRSMGRGLNWQPAFDHGEEILSMAQSGDGRYVATSGATSVHIWERATSRRIGSIAREQSEHMAFCPHGEFLLLGDSSRIRIASPTGTILRAINGDDRGGEAFPGFFVNDGRSILITAGPKSLTTVSLNTGSNVGDLWEFSQPITAYGVDRPGATAAIGLEDGRVTLMDIASRKPIRQLAKAIRQLKSLKFAHGGGILISLSGEHRRTLAVWDVASGRLFGTLQIPGDKSANQVSVSSDGFWVAIGQSDGRITIRDLRQESTVAELRGHAGPVEIVRFTSDGRWLISASADETLQIWDAVSLEPLGNPILLDTSCHAADIVPEGTAILTGEVDGEARFWFGPLGLPTVACAPNAQQPPLVLEFHPERDLAVAAFSGGSFGVWTPNHPVSMLPISWTTGPILTMLPKIRFSPEGTQFAVQRFGAGEGQSISVWKTEGSHDKPEFFLPAPTDQLLVEFSSRNKWLATVGRNKQVQLWDANNGKPIGSAMEHPEVPTQLRFDANARWLITQSRDQLMVFDCNNQLLEHSWKLASPDSWGLHPTLSALYVHAIVDGREQWLRWDGERRELATASLPIAQMRTVIVSPCGRWLAFVRQGKNVEIRSTETWDQPGKLIPLDSPTSSVQFRPDGKYLAITSQGNTAQLWHLGDQPQIIGRLTHRGPITDLRFSSDNQIIWTAGLDGTIRKWESSSAIPLGLPLIHEDAVRTIQLANTGNYLTSMVGSGARNSACQMLALPPSFHNVTEKELTLWLEASTGRRMSTDELSSATSLSTEERQRAVQAWFAANDSALKSWTMSLQAQANRLPGRDADFAAFRQRVEWWLGHRAILGISIDNGEPSEITKSTELPHGQFRIDHLTLDEVPNLVDADLERIRYFPDLKRLSISSANISGKGLLSLGRLKSLEHLSMLNVRGIDHGILRPLNPLPTLESLEIAGSSDDPELLATLLPKLTNLVTLNLSGARLGDSAVPELASLDHLETLQLVQSDATDALLDSVRKLESLRSLDLGGTRITDEGIRVLAKQPSIETLDLSQTKVGDASLETLAKLPKLTSLLLIQTKITQEAIDRFQKDYPNCNVVFVPGE